MNERKIKTLKNKPNHSKEYSQYLKKIRINKAIILSTQLILFVGIFTLWEIAAIVGAIDTFIMSSPSRIVSQFGILLSNGTLFYHIGITLSEAIIGFLIATIVGSMIAILLWWNETLRKILDPYIVVINSLPKIALGPILIIWIGAGTGAIIAMDILIMIVITILSMLNAFNSCDESKNNAVKINGRKQITNTYKINIA